MRFRVIAPRVPIPTIPQFSFVLHQDEWNDFSFQTQYHLYFKGSDDEVVLIGAVKILRKGQTKVDGLQIQNDFDALPAEYCSLGQTLDYYERLSAIDDRYKEEVLTALRDVIYEPKYIFDFKDEDGWNTSLLREFKENDEFFTLAGSLLERDYTKIPDENLSFAFKMPRWKHSLDFDFTAPEVGRSYFSQNRNLLPSRIIAIIGRNGSGKSTLLARLARVAHGSRKDRNGEFLSSLGSIVPDGIGFPRILTFSYSAFDSFQLPGIDIIEKEQIVRDVLKGEGRFVFCGLRDIARELQEEVKNKESNINAHLQDDRLKKTYLKSIDTLADEFERTLNLVRNGSNSELFDYALQILLDDPSFNEFRETEFTELFANPREIFLSLSTGHKIVLQIITSLTTYITPRSLVLIDEPETHLHPPLLAALMHAVRHVLDTKKAFAVIATHSPVVIQETMAKHVYIVKREGQVIDVKRTKIETFGENIGAITSEVFGLNSEVTDYHKILRKIARLDLSITEIENLFGEHGLSIQARAYIMSLLADKESK
ncbi:AAA family ATPase [Dyadobacter sp. CY347]|uniref:AAA family ATPase n=1 Tax=Dyadobacter sp. CY347 TaxID=2909336 RepID=UPI001F1EB70A|nr:AAA family ATPase [Dyadobacter sp. CY347]MCF2491132.1 AAA family ATPase [Dyadobacter sp. CY347]